MKNFPSSLNVNNKENFDKLRYNRFLSYLRRDVYEHIINNEEHDYFDLEKFDKNHYKNMEKSIQIVEIIVKELSELGWKCKLSYGQTALFIYSTENPPKTCWDDSFD